MYENVSLMNLDAQVTTNIVQFSLSKNKVVDALQGESELKAFLKSSREIKYFFIVLLWKKLYTDPALKPTLLKALALVKRAEYYHQVLIQCLQDIDEEFFRFIVESLNSLLGSTVNQFAQDPNEENHKQSAGES